MEIQLGDFYFKADGTVAILLACAPILAVMTIPKVMESIKRIVYLIKRYHKPTLQDIVDKYDRKD